MKFYAVHRGRQTGVFLTWEECKGKVLGYSNAKFRSFRTMVQAIHYVETGEILREKVRTLEECWFLPSTRVRAALPVNLPTVANT